MRHLAPILAAAGLLSAAAAAPRGDEPAGRFFFRPHDRVVFLGDSITIP